MLEISSISNIPLNNTALTPASTTFFGIDETSIG